MSKARRAILWSVLSITTFVILPAAELAAQTPQEKKEPPDDGAPEGPVPPYKEALKYYKSFLKRKSLMKHTEGRMMLAATQDLRALKVLTAAYGKGSGRAKIAKDQVAYLLVGIILRYFTEENSAPGFAAWRQKHKKDRDAWLWFWTLQSSWMKSRQGPIRTITESKENIYIKAGALEALARLSTEPKKTEPKPAEAPVEEAALATLVSKLLDALPADAIERSILVESCTAVLLAHKARVRNDTWKPIAKRLIQALVDEKIHERSKLALSRHFAELFDVPNLGFEPRLWIGKLNQGAAPKHKGGATVSTFFGVRSLGNRLCFVIDASDSMLTAVSAGEKQRLAAVTGPRKKKGDKSLPVEKRLPWDKIHNRFDVAREYLKLSLEGLDPSKKFAVILFGREAETLAATKKLVSASKANIRRAIAELDEIYKKKTGRLKGETNMHAGMLTAFRMTTANVLKKEEHVSRKALTLGCDTIYLLSDGAPSWDSYGSLDKRDAADGVMDPESGKRFTSQQRTGFYWGPYGRKPHKHMMDDFQRMNLFRKVQLHCIGIGEADAGLLDGIAKMGLGTAVKVALK